MLFIFERSSIFKYRRFYGLLKAAALFGCATLAAMPAYSSQALYTLTSVMDVTSPGTGNNRVNNSVAQIRFNNIELSNLAQGVVIKVPLPDGKVATGRVITSRKKSAASAGGAALSRSADSGIRKTIISLDRRAGSVELTLTNNAVTQMTIHDAPGEKIYLANINTRGDGQLRLQDNNDFYCVEFPQHGLSAGAALRSPLVAAQTPDLSILQTLQSRPGSPNVLYLDFWGGTLTDSYWNATYTSNAPINYEPFDRDGDPGTFTDQERYSMWLAWREAVEDFAPFEINITTDPAVYASAPLTSRSRMIITNTKSWYVNPSAGGVALVDIFNEDSEYGKVAWTWNLTDTSMGMTISHEAGHQLSLSHDGIGTETYYTGFNHDVWGPIMGAPFGKPYVQWSKGEYPGANQTEDDVLKITQRLGLLNDEAGNDFANATQLDLPVDNYKGVIGFGDTDAYKFTLSSAGQVDINVIPVLAGDNEARAVNLAMNVLLVKLNASGGVETNISGIDSSDNVPLSPLTNTYAYSGNLDAGDYALRVSPNSPDTNWATGFGNYANAGEYLLTASASSQEIRTIGRPVIDRSADTGLFLWENAKNRWALRVVSGDMPRIVEFDVTSNLGITDVVPKSIEPSDELNVFPKSLEMKFNVTAPWVDGIKFAVNDASDTCITMSNPDVPIFIGPDRVPMPAAFDLKTLGPCSFSIIRTLGKPSIDRSRDTGIFIWEFSNNTWVVNVVAANGNNDGVPMLVDVNVQSSDLLSNVTPISIEPDDIFIESPNSLEMGLNLIAPWVDGAKFTVVDQAATCISTTKPDVPIYLGPERINVGDNMNLSNLAACD